MASSVSIHQKQYSVPRNVNEVNFEEIDNIETLIITKDAMLQSFDSSAFSTLKTIQLSNGEINASENENIATFFVKENKYIVITRNQENEYLYSFINKDNLLTVQQGKILAGNPYVVKSPIYQYDYIEDIDINHIDDDMLLYIGVVGPEETQKKIGMNRTESLMFYDDCNEIYKGKVYTKSEVVQIKQVLDEIVSKINVPPQGIKDREKIIYAQLVQALHKYLNYDNDAYELIEKYKTNGEHSLKKDEVEMMDSSQNLKGLLGDKTVCAGFATIIGALCHRFDINCEVVANNDHAWNYVKLDGKNYEDDFTWYRHNLQVSDIAGIDMFLKGRNKNGERTFDGVKYHQVESDEELSELSEDISEDEMFNLLTTDWYDIENWKEIDISKPSLAMIKNSFPLQMKQNAESKKTMCLVALNKLKKSFISGTKSFINKVQDLFLGEQDR